MTAVRIRTLVGLPALAATFVLLGFGMATGSKTVLAAAVVVDLASLACFGLNVRTIRRTRKETLR